MDYLVGIDVGTTGVKSVLFNTQGEVIKTALGEYPLLTPQPLWIEQDPSDWWRATVDTLKKLTQGINPEEVRGVSLSGQMHGSVFLDKDYNVIRDCILWNDQRTEKQCRLAINQLGQDGLNHLIGNTVLSGFTLPKLLWLRENEPDNYEKVYKLLMPKDYVRYKLTDVIAAEVSDAAGTAMFDVKHFKWSEDLFKGLDLDISIMPECYQSIDVCGEITSAAAELTGLAAGTPVAAGGADNTCGAIGTGIIESGRAMASTGTSGIIFCHTDEVRMDPKQRIHSFCHSVPKKWYLMGCMLSAGLSFRWFRDQLGEVEVAEAERKGVDPYEILTQEAAQAPVGSEGLIFLPYLTGERSPHGDPHAKGVYFGITARHTKSHLIRSVLEGVSFGLRDMLNIMKELGQEVEEIRATGGGARSGLWRQIQADVLGAPLFTVNSPEGPALGAAILAGVGAGVYGSVQEGVEKTVVVTSETKPVAANVEEYDRYYEIYRGLYPRMKDDFRKVSELVGI